MVGGHLPVHSSRLVKIRRVSSFTFVSSMRRSSNPSLDGRSLATVPLCYFLSVSSYYPAASSMVHGVILRPISALSMLFLKSLNGAEILFRFPRKIEANQNGWWRLKSLIGIPWPDPDVLTTISSMFMVYLGCLGSWTEWLLRSSASVAKWTSGNHALVNALVPFGIPSVPWYIVVNVEEDSREFTRWSYGEASVSSPLFGLLFDFWRSLCFRLGSLRLSDSVRVLMDSMAILEPWPLSQAAAEDGSQHLECEVSTFVLSYHFSFVLFLLMRSVGFPFRVAS